VSDSKNQYILNRGDTVLMATPGGGGYGNPAARRATATAADAVAGYITPDARS
jgi:N-methylhydantoinase B